MDLLDDTPDKVYPVHGAETSLVIGNLESNTVYNITVSAKNQYGVGKTAQLQASKLFLYSKLIDWTTSRLIINKKGKIWFNYNWRVVEAFKIKSPLWMILI